MTMFWRITQLMLLFTTVTECTVCQKHTTRTYFLQNPDTGNQPCRRRCTLYLTMTLLKYVDYLKAAKLLGDVGYMLSSLDRMARNNIKLDMLPRVIHKYRTLITVKLFHQLFVLHQ